MFFIYIKISKNLPAKYYQENKERLQEKLVKDINFFKVEKEKKQQYGYECYKNLSENEKINWLSVEKNIK